MATKSTAPAKRSKPSTGKQRSERARAGKPAPAIPTTGRIKVRATQMGFYNLRRYRQGDVFVISKASEYSDRWMEVVEGKVPLKATGPQEALNQKHDEILGGKAQRPENPDDDDVE